MDTEFSEFANALLALRMGKPINPLGYTTDDQADNDTVGSEDDRMYLRKGLTSSVIAVPSSSWTAHDFGGSYDFLDQPTKQNRKRVHVTISATSSESNDAYDDHGRGITLEKRIAPKSGAEKKLARGRYRCSLCGAFKTNHTCALVADKLMCSVGTQSYASASVRAQKENSLEVLSPSAVLKPRVPSEYTLTVSSHGAGSKLNPSAGTAAMADLTNTFQERIVTVSRNRKSIQNPVPVPEEDVTVIMATSDTSCDGSLLKLRKPSTSDEPAGGMTSSSASSPSHAVTPNSPFSFARKLDLGMPVGMGMGMATYPPSTALSMQPLLSMPMQPMSAFPSFPPMQDRMSFVPVMPVAPAPAPAVTKAVPNLIYPSALDLLGHAIYE